MLTCLALLQQSNCHFQFPLLLANRHLQRIEGRQHIPQLPLSLNYQSVELGQLKIVLLAVRLVNLDVVVSEHLN